MSSKTIIYVTGAGRYNGVWIRLQPRVQGPATCPSQLPIPLPASGSLFQTLSRHFQAPSACFAQTLAHLLFAMGPALPLRLKRWPHTPRLPRQGRRTSLFRQNAVGSAARSAGPQTIPDNIGELPRE